MSAWVVALGLAAGYLINKNMVIKGQLEQSVVEHNSAARPSASGVTSSEVRAAWKSLDGVKYGDMNTDLPKTQMDSIAASAMAAAGEVAQFDAAVHFPRIQGVLLQPGV